jgi:rhodanese-related sulfurtransferase
MFPPSVPSVEPAGVRTDATVIDVRERDEWQAGHIEGALHVPLAELTARVGELPDGELVVVCRSGHRSARAVAWLVHTGLDAVNLDGGNARLGGRRQAHDQRDRHRGRRPLT